MNIEELRKKAEVAWEGCHHCDENDKNMWVNGYITGALGNQPELPSDEEIINEANNYVDNDHILFVTNARNSKRYSFSDGAQWVINKIQGGNK